MRRHQTRHRRLPNATRRLPGAMLCACTAGALLLGGCPRAKPQPPRWQADGGGLSGTWVGTVRSHTAAGVVRRVAVQLTLRTDGQWGIGGEAVLVGALDAGPGRKLRCARRQSARVRRTATVTVGRYSPRGARFGLSDFAVDAVSPCDAAVFPLPRSKPPQCTLTPVGAGRARLACGPFALSMRRVSLTGVWAWDETRGDRSGDTIRRHLRLHLVQSGDTLVGHADDIRERISGDEQRYRCNGRLAYVRLARHRLRGRLRGVRFGLQVRETLAGRGPCQGKIEIPDTWQGQWNPIRDEITLTLGTEKHVLWRRPGSAPAAAPAERPRRAP